MYIIQALSANGIGMVILISLLLNLRGKYDRKKDEHIIFTCMVAVNMLQCVIETATIVLDGKLFHGALALSTVLNTLLYINNIIFAMLWVVYADLRVRKSYRKHKKYVWVFVPGVLVILICFINLFVPVLFTIDENNIYHRFYPWVLIPYIVTYFYLIWGTFAAYIIRRKKDKYVFLPAFAFLFPVCLASIVQLALLGISLLWVGAAVGLMSAYMALQDERAAVDPLSGVFTRHYMNQHLDAVCKKAVPTQRLSGIMFDIDKFKEINDKYGHLIGDEVIHKFGKLLKRAIEAQGLVFRYAGDEFVIIVTGYSKAQLQELFQRVQEEIDKVNGEGNEYKIACSYGYATYVLGESPNHFLKRMDDAMYTNKNNKRRREGGKLVMEDQELVYAGIDMPELLGRLMQNKDLVRVFIKKFTEDTTYEKLCAVSKDGDWKQMEFLSHTLKGMCGNLSLKTLYSLFSEQVRLLRADEGEKAILMMNTIAEEYENAISHMKNWLEK